MPRRRGRRQQVGRERRGLQRAYGWFRCKQCNRHWESSNVYRVRGTQIVPDGQACKNCHVHIYVRPYRTECIGCREEECECYPEYNNYHHGYDDDDDDDDEYYGRHIDARKRHESWLCERCQTGRPCSSQRNLMCLC